MKADIQARFSPAILSAAQARYGIASVAERPAFESFIYEFERDGRAYILRIGHSLRRSVALIKGEVDWINYLAEGGAGVARAVLSEQGNLVERIDDGQGGYFLATAFDKAPGGPPMRGEIWNATLWEAYGRVLGRIHALSRDYTPSDPAATRPHWDDPIMLGTFDVLSAGETHIWQRREALIAKLHALPRDEDGYGMIHQDAHAGNFFVDDHGRITLFDFDDCVYAWYAYDIAMVLFYAVTNHPTPEAFAQAFFRPFMRGYDQENRLDRAWLATLPLFMTLRELDLYAVIADAFTPEQISGDGWIGTFMRGRRERLIDGMPYLNLDFNRLDWLAS